MNRPIPGARALAGFALVGTLLSFTLPSMNAGPRDCGPGLLPLRDLDSVLVIGRPEPGLVERVLLRQSVRGREGQRDTVGLDLAGAWQVWIQTKDTHGNVSCRSHVIEVGLVATVDPAQLSSWLGAPCPNPARHLVAIPWSLAAAGEATLEVLDLAGRRRALLATGPQGAGVHVALWDARGTPPGLFFIGLRTAAGIRWRKVVILR